MSKCAYRYCTGTNSKKAYLLSFRTSNVVGFDLSLVDNRHKLGQ